jgi:ribosomal protein L7/L12
MSLNGVLNDVLSLVRDLVVYGDSLADARSRALVIYSRIDSILDKVENGEEVQRKNRFALRLPAHQVWVEAANTYILAPERIVYFIDGYITESKILAIKQVRTIDGGGVKECKDYCDGLQVQARGTDK